MDKTTKKTAFLSVVSFLLLAIIGLSIFFATREPSKNTEDTPVQLLEKTAEAGSIFVKDSYNGEMQIPQYDIPLSQYAADKFKVDEQGVMSYENSALGISIKNKNEDSIDWSQVKGSGVQFVLLRVGFRDYKDGGIYIDTKFQENIKGALDAGLDVGVYFFSQAMTEVEAVEEAETVLNLIKDYQVKYPVMIKWDYAAKTKEEARTTNATSEQITNVVHAFCQKVKQEGYTAGFYGDKTFGYEKFDLTKLAEYDMWYTEYQETPAFYYDFKLWEYSAEGKVPGIADTVEMCIALKKYN
ncbi:GH25 family lysozyme [Scatolibacter rhodanostii]|uniref:GH25 family lysozyme n=1 Tax=Scatolibacter rhodanostii TaxID=2014781 RepID=UPI000C069E3C|nr:GH25 family lysozyme [Scatolibacter rhodanostii]